MSDSNGVRENGVREEDALAAMLDNMVRLQNLHNREVAEDWPERGFAFYRAVWIECAELLDHYGWKWWKHQQPDLEQVRLEAVDIWHFGLSMLIRDGEVGAPLARRFRACLGRPRPAERLREDVEALAGEALLRRRFSVEAFADVLDALDMDFTALYRTYIGKNVLNRFRQRHGYREGRYRKRWGEREDNEHLVELAAGLDPAAADFPERLHDALEVRYAETAPQAE